jgi:nucleoside-diphosphate-sugar epimerase
MVSAFQTSVHTCLVTGGAGFIGSHLVHELVRRGQGVRVLDNFSTGRRENLAQVLGRIELIEGDIRDRSAVQAATVGVDYVLHQAALASVTQSVADPMATHEVNVTGTLNVLLAARDCGVKRVVFASSCAIYGNDPHLPKREDMAPLPLSPYAASKLSGEGYCLAFHEVFGLPTVSLRYFNVFGPRQDPGSPYSAVIPRFIAAARKGEALTIYGDGMQSRDFVYVADVVMANLLACKATDAVGQVVNVASGHAYSLLGLVTHLKRLLVDKPLRVEHLDARPGDVRHSLGDIQKARHLLGYEPSVAFGDGLRETYTLSSCRGDFR